MKHIVNLPERPGRYTLLDAKDKKLYHGSSKNLRRRLEDEKRRRGDVRTVPGKMKLIDKAAKMEIEENNDVWENREREWKAKKGLPYNLK